MSCNTTSSTQYLTHSLFTDLSYMEVLPRVQAASYSIQRNGSCHSQRYALSRPRDFLADAFPVVHCFMDFWSERHCGSRPHHAFCLGHWHGFRRSSSRTVPDLVDRDLCPFVDSPDYRLPVCGSSVLLHWDQLGDYGHCLPPGGPPL